jgi:uncharacterized protein (DUF305 family)
MLRHHEAAIVMGRFVYQFGEQPAVKQFAAVMAAEQQRESVWMMQRLALKPAH